MSTLRLFIVIWLCAAAKADERIMVENARINGTPVNLAFDTGADDIYLFSPAVKRLGLKVSPLRNIWRQQIGIATEKSTIQFWAFTGKKRLPVIDLLATCDCEAIDGLVGWGPLWDEIVVFDTTNNTVRFVSKVPSEAKRWTKLKLLTEFVVMIQVPDGGKKGRMLIDTGSESGLGLTSTKWQEWRANHPAQPRTFHSAYMPGPRAIIVQEQAWASEFALGPLKFTDTILEESEPFSARNAGEKHLATLGLAALKRLDIVIDGKHGWAYIQPKRTPAAPMKHNRLGATFPPRDPESDPLFARVITGSPADEAGIRDNDELVKIGELDATRWREQKGPPGEHWQQPAGTRIPLTLRRSNEVFQTTVTLRDILPPKPIVP